MATAASTSIGRMEKLRAEVHQLLDEAAIDKLSRHGGRGVESRLRRAAKLSQGLWSPWPERVAYRLALILIRSGRKSRLREADQLLELAASCPALGPHPALYRLAVLHRRKARPAIINSAFRLARDRVRRVDRTSRDSVQLQQDLFNMLELAGCFLGRNHDDLDGIGAPLDDGVLRGRRLWTLVGNDPALYPVQYAREMAVCELEARGDENKSAILFREPLGIETGNATEYRLDASRGWERAASERTWELIRLVVRAQSCSRKRLEAELGGPGAFRTALRRARQWFKLEIDRHVLEVTGAAVVIDPEVRIYGVTPMSRLSR